MTRHNIHYAYLEAWRFHGPFALILHPRRLWQIALPPAKCLMWLGFEEAGWALLRATWWLRQRLYRRPS